MVRERTTICQNSQHDPGNAPLSSRKRGSRLRASPYPTTSQAASIGVASGSGSLFCDLMTSSTVSVLVECTAPSVSHKVFISCRKLSMPNGEKMTRHIRVPALLMPSSPRRYRVREKTYGLTFSLHRSGLAILVIRDIVIPTRIRATIYRSSLHQPPCW